MILKNCKWCNKQFQPTHNRQEYCCKKHSKLSENENTAKRMRKYRKKLRQNGLNPHTNQIGTTRIGKTRQPTWKQEALTIRKELKRIKNHTPPLNTHQLEQLDQKNITQQKT